MVARWGGPATATPLLLHGHLDVVPAEADDWQSHPFSGEIQDGYLWGRGAVDMKDFDAMLLSVVRARARAGAVPDAADGALLHRRRGGRRPPGRRADRATSARTCSRAAPRRVGEVGGFSATVRGRRLYLIEAAEKGMAWMRLTAKGNAGHGSMRHPDNAVTALAAAVARIGAHEWPVRLTPSMQVLLAVVGELAGIEATPGQRRGAGRGVRLGRPDARRGHPQHHQPDDARAPATR